MMQLDEARAVAEEVVAGLAPFCERIELAGSVRRGKAEPKDVEIVYLSELGVRRKGFWEEEMYFRVEDGIAALMKQGVLRKDEVIRRWGDKYKRCVHCETGMVVELFGAELRNWGYILALRTGPADFNKVLVSQQWQGGGAMPVEMRVRDGYLWRNGKLEEVRTEEAFFGAIAVPYWAPEERTVARLRGWLDEGVA